MERVLVKECFEKFKPESCVFILSVDRKGNPNGMIAGWHMKCSIDPPLLAISLSKKGNTHKLIKGSKEFVVAVPNKELEREVEFFGSTHGDKTDKLRETKIEVEKSKFIKTPLIKKATINFECKLEKEVDSGDHIIFIGRVLASYINKDKKILLNMGRAGYKRIFREF